MHLYMLLRGQHQNVQRWIGDVQGQYFDWKMPNGGNFRMPVQVRHMMPIELVFPRERKEEVLATVQPYDYEKELKPLIWSARTALGLKPITKFIAPNYRIPNNFINRIGIGIKDDDEHEQYPGFEKI